MKAILKYLIYTFSFFLAFGKYDPFETDGLYFTILTMAVVFAILIFSDAVKNIKKFGAQLLILFLIGLLLFIIGVIYGQPYFNFKYFSAVIIYWLLSYYFDKNQEVCYYSILFFAIASALIATMYKLGFLEAQYDFDTKGRLQIFEENPNSISTRMAIAFLTLLYIIIENPLKYNKLRFLLLLFLPGLFFLIVDSASRGSFLLLIIGVAFINLFSKIRKSIKFILLGAMLFIFGKVLDFIKGTSLFDRFEQDSNIIGSRGEIWKNAIQIFYDNPYGVGEHGYISEMLTRYSYYLDTHNLYLYFLTTGGVFTLLLFLFFLRRLFIKSLINLKQGNSFSMIIFIFLIFLAAKTGGVLTYLIMWYFFAVVNGLNINKLENEINSSSRLGSI